MKPLCSLLALSLYACSSIPTAHVTVTREANGKEVIEVTIPETSIINSKISFGAP